MRKVVVFDESNYGHHFFYNYNVLKALSKQYNTFYYTQMDEDNQKKELEELGVKVKNIKFKKQQNILFTNLYNIWVLTRLFVFSTFKKMDLVHLIYFDRYYFISLFCLPTMLLFSLGKGKLVLTCHQIPERKVKLLSIKILLRLNMIHKVIVHGEYLLKALKQYTGEDKRLVSLDYPARESEEYPKEICLKRLGITPIKRPVVLYFGGTRYDKGMDILLDSLKNVKADYFLVIAGTDDYFNRDFIANRIKENQLDVEKIAMHFKYIDESDVDYYFSLADIVVLPYRKIFSGQSGPLTEGISHHCVIIGPDIKQINQTLGVEGNGIIYKAESIDDLSRKLEQCLENIEAVKKSLLSKQNEYKDRTSTLFFRDKYLSLFNAYRAR